jgi:hypothetical protein
MDVFESLAFLAPAADKMFLFFGADPLVRFVQVLLGICAASLVFLVFWTTRDVLLRTRSLVFQLTSILMVAALPLVGFFFYLLIRPSMTLKQKKIEQSLLELSEILARQKSTSFKTGVQTSPNVRILEKKINSRSGDSSFERLPTSHKLQGVSRTSSITATEELKTDSAASKPILSDAAKQPSRSPRRDIAKEKNEKAVGQEPVLAGTII